MISEPTSPRLPTHSTGVVYTAQVLMTSLALLLASLASFNYAMDFMLGPLEGLALDSSGGLRPEAVVRVALVSLEPAASATAPSSLPGGTTVEIEQARWQHLLTHPTVHLDTIGLDALPSNSEQADVVILPWGTQLEDAQLERLLRFLGHGGGVLALGPVTRRTGGLSERGRADARVEGGLVGSKPPPPRDFALPTDVMDELFGVSLQGLSLPPVSTLHLEPLPDGLLGAAIPPGYGLRLNVEALEPRGIALAKHPVANWVETLASTPAGESGPELISDRRPAALATSTYLAGRTAWLAVPLSQLHRDHNTQSVLQESMLVLMRWLSQRPALTRFPTPDARTPTAVVIEVDSVQGSLAMADLLEARHLRPTWLTPAELATGYPALLERLRETGELALQGASGMRYWAQSAQQAHLINQMAALQGRFRKVSWGFRPALGEDGRALRDLLQNAGYHYLLPAETRERFRQEQPTVRTALNGPPLLVLPSPTVRWDVRAEAAAPPGASLLETWQGRLPSPSRGGWAILQLSSQLANTAEGVHALSSSLDALQAETLNVAPLGELAATWQQLQRISAIAQRLKANRVHLRLQGGEEAVPQLRLRMELPDGWEIEEIVSHHFRPAELTWSSDGSQTATLTVRKLAPQRIQDFFLALKRVEAKQ